MAVGAAALLCAGLAACGGRPSNPVAEHTDLDDQLSCTHLRAEKRSLNKRIVDLQDERNTNRVRSISRVPGALISGNPFSAIFFADPSVAIYKEIAAAQRRIEVINVIKAKKGCNVVQATAPVPTPKPIESAAAAKPVASPVEPKPVEMAATPEPIETATAPEPMETATTPEPAKTAASVVKPAATSEPVEAVAAAKPDETSGTPAQ